MTARVLTGSKQQIAQQVVGWEGEVREAIVFVEEPIGTSGQAVPETSEELFREMEPYSTKISPFDDSREAIYQRMEGE
jgi:hypothetical protein